jgi:hypothetical protein
MKQLKNLMTSKNRKELTNIFKLIKEIDNDVCSRLEFHIYYVNIVQFLT